MQQPQQKYGALDRLHIPDGGPSPLSSQRITSSPAGTHHHQQQPSLSSLPPRFFPSHDSSASAPSSSHHCFGSLQLPPPSLGSPGSSPFPSPFGNVHIHSGFFSPGHFPSPSLSASALSSAGGRGPLNRVKGSGAGGGKHGRKASTASIGPPPKAQLGGPQKKKEGPEAEGGGQPPMKKKKVVVRLPRCGWEKEDEEVEEGHEREWPLWTAAPTAREQDRELRVVEEGGVELDIFSRERGPEESREGPVETLEVYVPGKVYWKLMREDIINEKLAALGGVVEVPQFSHAATRSIFLNNIFLPGSSVPNLPSPSQIPPPITSPYSHRHSPSSAASTILSPVYSQGALPLPAPKHNPYFPRLSQPQARQPTSSSLPAATSPLGRGVPLLPSPLGRDYLDLPAAATGYGSSRGGTSEGTDVSEPEDSPASDVLSLPDDRETPRGDERAGKEGLATGGVDEDDEDVPLDIVRAAKTREIERARAISAEQLRTPARGDGMRAMSEIERRVSEGMTREQERQEIARYEDEQEESWEEAKSDVSESHSIERESSFLSRPDHFIRTATFGIQHGSFPSRRQDDEFISNPFDDDPPSEDRALVGHHRQISHGTRSTPSSSPMANTSTSPLVSLNPYAKPFAPPSLDLTPAPISSTDDASHFNTANSTFLPKASPHSTNDDRSPSPPNRTSFLPSFAAQAIFKQALLQALPPLQYSFNAATPAFQPSKPIEARALVTTPGEIPRNISGTLSSRPLPVPPPATISRATRIEDSPTAPHHAPFPRPVSVNNLLPNPRPVSPELKFRSFRMPLGPVAISPHKGRVTSGTVASWRSVNRSMSSSDDRIDRIVLGLQFPSAELEEGGRSSFESPGQEEVPESMEAVREDDRGTGREALAVPRGSRAIRDDGGEATSMRLASASSAASRYKRPAIPLFGGKEETQVEEKERERMRADYENTRSQSAFAEGTQRSLVIGNEDECFEDCSHHHPPLPASTSSPTLNSSTPLLNPASRHKPPDSIALRTSSPSPTRSHSSSSSASYRPVGIDDLVRRIQFLLDDKLTSLRLSGTTGGIVHLASLHPESEDALVEKLIEGMFEERENLGLGRGKLAEDEEERVEERIVDGVQKALAAHLDDTFAILKSALPIQPTRFDPSTLSPILDTLATFKVDLQTHTSTLSSSLHSHISRTQIIPDQLISSIFRSLQPIFDDLTNRLNTSAQAGEVAEAVERALPALREDLARAVVQAMSPQRDPDSLRRDITNCTFEVIKPLLESTRPPPLDVGSLVERIVDALPSPPAPTEPVDLSPLQFALEALRTSSSTSHQAILSALSDSSASLLTSLVDAIAASQPLPPSEEVQAANQLLPITRLQAAEDLAARQSAELEQLRAERIEHLKRKTESEVKAVGEKHAREELEGRVRALVAERDAGLERQTMWKEESEKAREAMGGARIKLNVAEAEIDHARRELSTVQRAWTAFQTKTTEQLEALVSSTADVSASLTELAELREQAGRQLVAQVELEKLAVSEERLLAQTALAFFNAASAKDAQIILEVRIEEQQNRLKALDGMSRYLDEARARIMQGEEELARLRGVVKEAEKKRGEEEETLRSLRTQLVETEQAHQLAESNAVRTASWTPRPVAASLALHSSSSFDHDPHHCQYSTSTTHPIIAHLQQTVLSPPSSAERHLPLTTGQARPLLSSQNGHQYSPSMTSSIGGYSSPSPTTRSVSVLQAMQGKGASGSMHAPRPIRQQAVGGGGGVEWGRAGTPMSRPMSVINRPGTVKPPATEDGWWGE